MAYSIHGHISWILETSSERPNDFSLIRKKPSEILEFTWKKLMLLKFKSNLNSKFMLKGSKTIKIMKKSKSRRGLTQIKVIFFAYKNIYIYQYTVTTRLKGIVSGCVVRSEHHADILIAKSIGKEHLLKLSHLSKRLFLFGIQ